MISASFLSIKDNLEENLKVLESTNIDYIHVDIMDYDFVNNQTNNNKIIDILKRNR
jgi:pentose-5-phosphate-3-epimerase